MLEVNIQKRFKGDASSSFDLDVAFGAGQGITVLFGPSGAGKTTILRAVAGIVTPDEGKIALGDRIYFDFFAGVNLPIQKRKVGVVFQDYALFPHLTAEQNAAYGTTAGSGKARRRRARALLALVGIEHAAGRYPRELSGGEQQRLALARALASEPSILLLDEPLSAVDVSTRSRLLEEIVHIQRESGIPFLYVTHNQAEAVRIGDALLVLHQGRIVQRGCPLEVLNAPQSLAAARAVGMENVFVGRVGSHQPREGTTTIELDRCHLFAPYNGLPCGTLVTVGLRADDILISRERVTQTSARNILEGTIRTIIRDAQHAQLVVDCGTNFKVSVTPGATEALRLAPQTRVYLLIKATACHLLS